MTLGLATMKQEKEFLLEFGYGQSKMAQKLNIEAARALYDKLGDFLGKNEKPCRFDENHPFYHKTLEPKG